MARHVIRIAPWVLIATAALLSGCAATSKTHHLQAVVADQRQAETAYEKGNLAQALTGYEALTRTMPDNGDFWFRLGNIHVRMDQPDLAVSAYEHALKLDSANAKAWHNLGIVRMRQAAAAFVQSAHAAGPDAPELGRVSAQLAHSLAALASPAEEKPSASAPTVDQEQKGTPVSEGPTP